MLFGFNFYHVKTHHFQLFYYYTVRIETDYIKRNAHLIDVTDDRVGYLKSRGKGIDKKKEKNDVNTFIKLDI